MQDGTALVGGNLVTPDKTTIQFLEADPEGAFQAE